MQPAILISKSVTLQIRMLPHRFPWQGSPVSASAIEYSPSSGKEIKFRSLASGCISHATMHYPYVRVEGVKQAWASVVQGVKSLWHQQDHVYACRKAVLVKGSGPHDHGWVWKMETRGDRKRYFLLGWIFLSPFLCMLPSIWTHTPVPIPLCLKWKIIKVYLHSFNIRLLKSYSQYNRGEKNYKERFA